MRGLIGWVLVIAFAMAAPLPAFASQAIASECGMDHAGPAPRHEAPMDCEQSCLAPGGWCANCAAIEGADGTPKLCDLHPALPPATGRTTQLSGIADSPEPPPPRAGRPQIRTFLIGEIS